MDRCTREVRKQYWKNIISQCLQRPKGMSAKQWLDENSICEQTYYYWLKRIRQETYELTTTSNTLPVQTNQNEVTFAEILRASQKSTIITSNLTFERWDEIFGDAAITSAIVDRLTYKAYLIDMEGDSYRLRETLRYNGTDFETVVK